MISCQATLANFWYNEILLYFQFRIIFLLFLCSSACVCLVDPSRQDLIFYFLDKYYRPKLPRLRSESKNNNRVEVDRYPQKLGRRLVIGEMAKDNIVSQNKARCSPRVSGLMTQGRSRPLHWATPPLNDLASLPRFYLHLSIHPSVSPGIQFFLFVHGC